MNSGKTKTRNEYLKIFLISDQSVYLYVVIAAILIFCLLYGVHVLNPVYTDWLLAGGDLSQHYLGWKAYRNSAWMFPIGMLDTLAYPSRTSVIFTDSLPLFAVPFKVLSPILPADFQYFGLWGIMCFALQAFFAARIIKNYSKSKMFVAVSSILVVFTPVMIWRMYAHTALAGQWILLYGLEPIFNYKKYAGSSRPLFMHACILGLLSPAIHMYFVLMSGIILVGICLYDMLNKHSLKRTIGVLAIYIGAAALIVGLLGGFSSGMQASQGGLGTYSFNLNAFFNPQGWSCIYQTLPLYGNGQYEGLAYLGAGVILILFVGLICLIGASNRKEIIQSYAKCIISLLVIFMIAVAAAVSPVITFNDICIVNIPLPEFIFKAWSVFRASGRVIWIAIYIIVFCSLILIAKLFNRRTAAAFAIAALALQVYDSRVELENRHEKFNQIATYDSTLKNEKFWNHIAEDTAIKHIIFTDLQLSERDMYAFTDWATRYDKTVNTFYFPRSNEEELKHNLETAYKQLPPENLYIFFEKNMLACLKYDLHYYKVDNYVVGYVNPIEGQEAFDPRTAAVRWAFGGNQYLQEGSGQDTENGRILYPGGLSFGPYWMVPAGTWEITIEGEQLEGTDILVYSQRGERYHDFELEKRDKQITINLPLAEDVEDLEIVIRSTSNKNILLKQMSIKHAGH